MEYKLETKIADRKGKTIYKSGDACVKLFDSGISKADILNEALNHARVEEAGLNVPTLREVTKINGKWAIVLDYIEGKTLSELILENKANLNKYLDSFVNLQVEMHKKKCPKLIKLKDKMNAKISASGLDATIRYELHHLIDGMPKHYKLCHGDFNPSNIIVTQEGKMFIIDWSHATQGNASADVARTYLLFMLNDQKDIAEKYLTLFCKKADTAKQYVQKWMPIVAASQLVKGNEEEREFLLRWANVVDFE